MNKKSIVFVIISSLVIGGIGGWIFTRYVMPIIGTIPILVKYNLAPPVGPLVITRREEIHVNEGADTVAAIQAARPWLVGVIAGVQSANVQIESTGIILTSDGIIALSKNIPSAGSSAVRVALPDGRVLPAALLSVDSESSLALYKVNASDLSVAPLGSANQLSLGQRVAVVTDTVNEQHPTAQVSYISTDGGNAGSVLSSDAPPASFKVQGLASIPEGSVVISTDGNVQGIFVGQSIISADTIHAALDSYFRNGKITNKYFGFHYQLISKTEAGVLKIVPGLLVRKTDLGATAVIAGSPAAKAGLQEGDIITSINGDTVNFDNSFAQIETKINAGDTITFTINRNGKEMNINITVGAK